MNRRRKRTISTTLSCIRRVENLAAVIPDGEYKGTWGGYVVRFKVDGKQYEAASSVGIRTQNAPCIVSVRDCLVTVRVVGQ
jgi:FAD synthase